ncbi:TonB-dependent receptor [Edaphobacter albus]|uniref:TonB-dependent receptor n=1 Tax=Edaphobacter sp. 4G125 TaxID=2763071 RepID=UPI0016457ED8|nr:TonB-dependent receptor [Edaphobacter sp. 4G125]QNI37361.1 TonB-dependent receptor [Edaphobacter sp. 4G125]
MPNRSKFHHLKRPGRLTFVLGLLCIALPTANSNAQSIQGSVIGNVHDSANAVIPNATVTLMNVDEGTSRTATTGSDGNYRFIDAKAGHYTVQVTAPGFAKWSVTNAILAARQDLRIDATMHAGSVQQEMVVSAEAVNGVETDDPSISSSYNTKQIATLPVNTRASSTGTSAINIVGTLPGVQAAKGAFSLQGGLPFQTEISVDGITVQNTSGSGPLGDAFPSSEGISEMRADGTQNSAEFGQPGEITVITKGGTNVMHGSAFWYHQNAAFNAIPYTFPITPTKPKLVANTFGASFGGPVVIPHLYNGRNRTFIFGDYEGWRYPAQTTKRYVVPTAAMKKGDFSNYNSPGFAGLQNPFTGASYGKVLPSSSINAATQKLLQFFPDPNTGNIGSYIDDGSANYITNKDQSKSSNQFDIRGDQYFGSNQKFLVWGRYTWKNFPQNQPQTLSVQGSQNTIKSRVLKVDANYTITPRLINEFGYGFTRYSSGTTNSFNGKDFTNGLGLNGLQNLFYNGLPELDFNNLTNLDADRLDSVSQSNTSVYTDGLSWSLGKHQLKFGLDIRTIQAITPLGFNGADNYGTFGFNTSGSQGLFTGVDFADFLLGLPYQTFYDVVSQDNNGKSTHYHFYAQDQWAATPNLTLSYGVRYELHPPYSDVHGDIGNFDPSRALSGSVIYPDGFSNLLATGFLASANACMPYGTSSGATINGAPCMPVLSNSQAGYPGGLKHYPKYRIMPRFGFAWRPFSNTKTSVRGGFGMYNITLLGSNFYSLTGTLQAQTTQYTNTYNPTTNAIGYQWPNIYAGAGNGGCFTCYGQGYFGTANSTNWKDPYTEQWSLGIDQDLGQGYTMRLSYIGSITRHLVYAPDENTLPFSSTVSAYNQPLSARRFPNWGRINTRDTGANSNYNSMQLEFAHRYHNGLQFDSIYTFAKGLANNQGPGSTSFTGEAGGGRATTILDHRVDFGNVYGTRRSLWNTTMVYDLPFGRGRMYGGNMSHMLDLLVGGWQMTNIFLLQSGPFESPYFPSGQGDPSGTGSGLNGSGTGYDPGHRNQYPDRVASAPISPSNRTRMTWVNKAAFTCPGNPNWQQGTPCTTGSGSGPVPLPIGRFGNAGTGVIVGPGTVSLSSGLSKSFAITERVRLRAEGTFQNVLNHTNLGDPNMNVSSPTFGRITGTLDSGSGTSVLGARNGQVAVRLDF